jgi:hypothetical protein
VIRYCRSLLIRLRSGILLVIIKLIARTCGLFRFHFFLLKSDLSLGGKESRGRVVLGGGEGGASWSTYSTPYSTVSSKLPGPRVRPASCERPRRAAFEIRCRDGNAAKKDVVQALMEINESSSPGNIAPRKLTVLSPPLPFHKTTRHLHGWAGGKLHQILITNHESRITNHGGAEPASKNGVRARRSLSCV